MSGGGEPHAAVYVTNGIYNGPNLYDPGGMYGTVETRGTSDALYGGDAAIGLYIADQLMTGSNVTTYSFNTTPAQEMRIAQQANSIGGLSAGLCAKGVSGALSGVGPFQNLPSFLLPSSLGNGLSKLPGVSIMN